jgi:2-alkyl-3-oxoalkanoate reductase
MKTAIIGADGCLGTRLVESFQLGDGPSVAAITQSVTQLARPARFAIDLRVADNADIDSLARSLSGCSTAVHTMPVGIADLKRAATVFCRAAAQVGLRRIVYVGSADVHGLNPPSGTDERSPLHIRHASERANALVAAERQFITECRDLGLSGIVLRPGLIYGPRSEFLAQIAAELQADRAFLFNRGQGICNCVYVDNVVAAVRLALKTKSTTGSAFLVTDDEAVTWTEFYQTAAHELNLSANEVRYFDDPGPGISGQKARSFMPTDRPLTDHEWSTPPSRDTIARHHCRWKFPNARAAKELTLQGLVPFSEGMQRTAAWWHFAHADFPAVA